MQNTETREADQVSGDLINDFPDLGLTVQKLYECIPPTDNETDADWLKMAREELNKFQETLVRVG